MCACTCKCGLSTGVMACAPFWEHARLPKARSKLRRCGKQVPPRLAWADDIAGNAIAPRAGRCGSCAKQGSTVYGTVHGTGRAGLWHRPCPKSSRRVGAWQAARRHGACSSNAGGQLGPSRRVSLQDQQLRLLRSPCPYAATTSHQLRPVVPLTPHPTNTPATGTPAVQVRLLLLQPTQ